MIGGKNSSENFKKHIKRITKDINAYYEPIPKASYAFLVIHEHLGLVENIVEVCKYMVGTKITLMIPDLFTTVTSKTLLNNEFDAVNKLRFSRVYEVIMSCCEELKKTHKSVALMGFSVGSAYGVKILESVGDEKVFERAFMFYGLPNLRSLDVQRIKTKTVLFHGTEDKIKYLSDPKMYEAFLEKGPDLRNTFKIQQLPGVGHGFLNPETPGFSKDLIQKCQKMIADELPKDAIEKDKQQKNKEQKKQDCRLF